MNYSPILSIITAVFELSIIVWTLKSVKRTNVTVVSCAILLLLILYQILEVFVCSSETSSLLFSRLGFLVITWLPASGLLLICFLFPYRSKILLRFVQLMLLAAFLLNIWIISDPNFVKGTVCKIDFASYDSSSAKILIYGAYYQLGLLAMLVLSALGVIQTADGTKRKKMGQVLLGTISFVFPAMMLSIAYPPADDSLTSVLCHFAIFLAIFLARLIFLEKKKLKQFNSELVLSHHFSNYILLLNKIQNLILSGFKGN